MNPGCGLCMPMPDDRRGRILREGLSCVKLRVPARGSGRKRIFGSGKENPWR